MKGWLYAFPPVGLAGEGALPKLAARAPILGTIVLLAAGARAAGARVLDPLEALAGAPVGTANEPVAPDVTPVLVTPVPEVGATADVDSVVAAGAVSVPTLLSSLPKFITIAPAAARLGPFFLGIIFLPPFGAGTGTLLVGVESIV